MNKKQPWLIAAALLIIVLIAGVLYFILKDKDGIAKYIKNKCPKSFEPIMSAGPYYEKELLDAHLHLPTPTRAVSTISIELGYPTPQWDKELSLNYLSCLFGDEDTSGAYGFHLFTKYSMSAEVKMAKEMEKQYPGMIAHFLMPTMISKTIDPSIEDVDKALEENPGLFRGLGELKMYDGRSADDPHVLELLDLARKYNLVVMMHPFNNHKLAVEKIVKQYSDLTFLFHGIVEDAGPKQVPGNLAWLENLIKNNANVYYSIDAGLPIYGWLKEHQGRDLPKEDILQHSELQFNAQLAQDILNYKGLIEKYPDRFLRGTDRWYGSHYDKKLSALLEEYTRALIGRLSPQVQDKFAYKNARSLIGK